MSEPRAFSVSELAKSLQSLLDQHFPYAKMWVVGEISNYKKYPSGHHYFNLKDEEAQLSCVLFKNYARNLQFEPKEGMKIRLQGSPNLYAPSGRFSYVVTAMEEEGQGALYARYLELKQRLEAEGLFEHKRELPRFPRRVGVITSAKGAVIQDIRNVSFRRSSFANLLLYPAAVQGAQAAAQLRAGVAYFNRMQNVDVILIARGGGSIEDLWCFNDEMLVREIAKSSLPVVSAVGHETDFTLCDFAADVRAPTPSAGAELIWPEETQLRGRIQHLRDGMEKRMQNQLNQAQMRLSYLERHLHPQGFMALQQGRYQALQHLQLLLQRHSPERRLTEQGARYRLCRERMEQAMLQLQEKRGHRLEVLLQRLDQLNPLRVLRRGYALLENEEGRTMTSVRDIQKGERVTLSLRDGKARCRVESIQRMEESM